MSRSAAPVPRIITDLTGATQGKRQRKMQAVPAANSSQNCFHAHKRVERVAFGAVAVGLAVAGVDAAAPDQVILPLSAEKRVIPGIAIQAVGAGVGFDAVVSAAAGSTVIPVP